MNTYLFSRLMSEDAGVPEIRQKTEFGRRNKKPKQKSHTYSLIHGRMEKEAVNGFCHSWQVSD